MNNNTNIISQNCLPVLKGKAKTNLLKNIHFKSIDNIKSEKHQDNKISFNDELFKLLTVPGAPSLTGSSIKISTANNDISAQLNTNSHSVSVSLNNTTKTPLASKKLLLAESLTGHQKTDKSISTTLFSKETSSMTTVPPRADFVHKFTQQKAGSATSGVESSISTPKVFKANKLNATNQRQDGIFHLSSNGNSSRVKLDKLSVSPYGISETPVNLSESNKQTPLLFSTKNTASKIQSQFRPDLTGKISEKTSEQTQSAGNKTISESALNGLSVKQRSEETSIKQTDSKISSSTAKTGLNMRHPILTEKTDNETGKKINTDNNLSKNISIKESVGQLYSETHSDARRANDKHTDNLSNPEQSAGEKQFQPTAKTGSLKSVSNGSEPLPTDIFQSKVTTSTVDITPKNFITGSPTTQAAFQSNFPFISNYIKTFLTTSKTGDLVTTTFNLKPEHLGKLKVSLISHNNSNQDKTSISELKLFVDNITTKQLLESNISQLKSALLSEGITIQEFNISLNQDASNNTHQPLSGNNHSRLSTPSSLKDESDFDRNIVPSGINLAYEQGKIDLFI
ncbi:MAG: flagellar hook-length control protein FliK [bacterium]|nr:flagellar hook-length control protein FliK [bacterium]